MAPQDAAVLASLGTVPRSRPGDRWHPFQRVEVPEVVSVYCGISAYLLPTSLGRQDPLVASQAAVT